MSPEGKMRAGDEAENVQSKKEKVLGAIGDAFGVIV
jgi:hypothetical protein